MVPEELVDLLAPWLSPFSSKIQQMEAAGQPIRSYVRAFEQLSRYLMVVVVQDALELARDYPHNPAHALLLQSATFRLVAHEQQQHEQRQG